MEERLRRAGPWLVLLAAFVLKTWGIWWHLARRHYALWGMLFDTLHMDWMSWWASVAISQPGESLTFSTWLNAPAGGPTVMSHSLAGVHVTLAGLLRLVMPGPAAHNLVALAGCAFTLVALFLLLRHLSQNGYLAAGLAALVFTFGLGWAGTLPDLEVLYFGYTPLGLLLWLKYVEEGGWWRFALAAALVAWTAFAQMYYGLAILGMLTVASLGAWGRLSFGTVPPERLWRRTLPVLLTGLVLAGLAHARNIGTTMAMAGGGPTFEIAPLPPNHVSEPLWRGLLLATVIGLPLVAAWRLRLKGVLLWLLMVLPLAVLSLGEELGGLSMPLRYVRAVQPILNRISFGFRFVPPVLLGLGAATALFWRHRERVLPAPGMARRHAVYGWLLLALFWLGAAYGPVVPRFERLPFEADAVDGAACSAAWPDVCTMTQRWVNRCSPAAGAGRPEEPTGALAWAAGQFLRPFRPQATMPLPGPSRCIEWLSEAPGDGTLLEFSRSPQNGYRAYFQTFHHRRLGGFPIRNGTERNVEPTELARLPFAYQQGELAVLPEADVLRGAGVSLVALYRGEALAPCNFGIPQRTGSAPPGVRPGETAFAKAYGEPVCEDEVLSIYRLGLGKAERDDTLAP